MIMPYNQALDIHAKLVSKRNKLQFETDKLSGYARGCKGEQYLGTLVSICEACVDISLEIAILEAELAFQQHRVKTKHRQYVKPTTEQAAEGMLQLAKKHGLETSIKPAMTIAKSIQLLRQMGLTLDRLRLKRDGLLGEETISGPRADLTPKSLTQAAEWMMEREKSILALQDEIAVLETDEANNNPVAVAEICRIADTHDLWDSK